MIIFSIVIFLVIIVMITAGTAVLIYSIYKYQANKKLKTFSETLQNSLTMGILIPDVLVQKLLTDRLILFRKFKRSKKVTVLSEQELLTQINTHNNFVSNIIDESRLFAFDIKIFWSTGKTNVEEAVNSFYSVVQQMESSKLKKPYEDNITKAFILYERLSTFNGLNNVINVRKNVKGLIDKMDRPFTKYFDANDSKCKERYASTRTYLKNSQLVSQYIFDMNEVDKFNHLYDNFESTVREKNDVFVRTELKKHVEFFSYISGYSLDQQQRKAIVTDEVNSLYIAGAGAGKTLTVVGNVKYLVEKRGVSPEKILLISFTNKAVDELQERITKGNDYSIKATTFHKLGLSILAEHTGKKQAIYSDDQAGLIKNLLIDEVMKNDKAMEWFVEFMALYYIVPVNPADYDKQSDYFQDLRRQELTSLKGRMHEYEADGRDSMTTLKGEKIKSIEELIIANYLYIHGINYEYERPYVYDTSDTIYRQYYPDFYLTDYDIWLEHFGVDQEGRAKWLTSFEEKKYQDGMEWKRSLHEEYGTTLIETYSYYSKNGNLIEKLSEILKENGVSINAIDSRRILEMITREKRGRQFEDFSRLMSTFIQLFKSNGYNNTNFDRMKTEVSKSSYSFMRERESTILYLATIVYNIYEKYLSDKKQIDFADMINQATEVVMNTDMDMGYDYIFIDEYQDIATGRFNLVKAIREKSNAKVVAVGDDFQSIYRFAGSDIGMFMNFESYFGKTEVMKIETTYRNSRELIDIAGAFIQKNSAQIKKQLKSSKSLSEPVKIVESDYGDMVAAFTATMLEIYQNNPNGDILVLGRNNYNKNPLLDTGRFYFKDDDTLVYDINPNIRMKYLTVHRSKGLEADNVILLNVINHTTGFPNQTVDDPILRLVLNYTGEYKFDEERRLFYVALTRTKNSTYIMTQPFKHSDFVAELITDNKIEVKKIGDGSNNVVDVKCPKCGSSQLKFIDGKFGKFVGCGNYPHCDYTHKDISSLRMNKKCPRCGDYMVKRNGRYGEFYGCNNYPFCDNTEKIV